METVNAVGRRKAAVARVIVKEGTGVITINKRPLEVYFPSSILQYIVKQPLSTLDVAEKYDILVNIFCKQLLLRILKNISDLRMQLLLVCCAVKHIASIHIHCSAVRLKKCRN